MIAEMINPVVRGWMNDFGCYKRSAMKKTLLCTEKIDPLGYVQI